MKIFGAIVVGAFALVGVYATGSKVYDHCKDDKSKAEA